MIAIVDYGMGNLLSVRNGFLHLGADAVICSRPAMLAEADRIVVPGVGAFRDAMTHLREHGFVSALDRERLRGKPILGICLGLQVMARRSEEFGLHDGLGWFDAEVVRISPADADLRVPHVGWDNLSMRRDHPLFQGLPEHPDFYFVHSYHMLCRNEADIAATCDYGGAVTAAVGHENVFACQFHPEKSQDYGLRILENFVKWKP